VRRDQPTGAGCACAGLDMELDGHSPDRHSFLSIRVAIVAILQRWE
jgi:hypothetical protein